MARNCWWGWQRRDRPCDWSELQASKVCDTHSVLPRLANITMPISQLGILLIPAYSDMRLLYPTPGRRHKRPLVGHHVLSHALSLRGWRQDEILTWICTSEHGIMQATADKTGNCADESASKYISLGVNWNQMELNGAVHTMWQHCGTQI